MREGGGIMTCDSVNLVAMVSGTIQIKSSATVNRSPLGEYSSTKHIRELTRTTFTVSRVCASSSNTVPSGPPSEGCVWLEGVQVRV